ncbi:hypothetical protein KFV08_10320 [Macrococcoides canis]|uniref:hypothetical protein n=1 Tax=Macrococcoides canis TaxID=1855823 RepID=UPI0021FFBE39|nr:hypothetical protein [Macrococcus canis]MCO4097693.1 hypothetical protein [Macrococcus canis]UTH08870.1 hypothetical protein KFV08_10320 [Macrococcus canis]
MFIISIIVVVITMVLIKGISETKSEVVNIDKLNDKGLMILVVKVLLMIHVGEKILQKLSSKKNDDARNINLNNRLYIINCVLDYLYFGL